MSVPHGMKISEPHTHPYRWVMLTLLWLIYFSFGLVARSPSPLVTPIIKDLNVTFGQMGFVLGSWQMTYILVAVMAGVILDRWGIRKSIFAGVLVIGLSAVLRALSTGFVTLFIFVALFGVGGPMVSIGCPKAIALWFKGKERGMAVGIYTTGPWIGGMVSLAATNSLIMPLVGNSWRLAFVFCGMIAFIFAMLWWFMAKEAEETISSERSGAVEVLVALIKIHNVRILTEDDDVRHIVPGPPILAWSIQPGAFVIFTAKGIRSRIEIAVTPVNALDNIEPK